ncbi:glycoside hydrolase family 3 N-terminal domain-containing protein [Arthrobacter sp. 2RAF6]|uniref:glycoside hydrolase family 3 protein n=1 Tax=Arthrobacter sp. 2RAF6 TaxID=3233002 RepID=UPI003F8F643D
MEHFSTASRGPRDAPLLLTPGPTLEFDVDDVDGRLFMLDRDFGGTGTASFSKPMDPTVGGVVTLDGEPAGYVLKHVDLAGGLWMLGVKVFGRLIQPATEHALHIEGFADTDGNTMEPRDLAVLTRPRDAPDPRFAEHEAVALRVAEEGIVLLENAQATLPLAPGQLNVFGHALHAFRTTVVGAGRINPRYTIGLREAIRSSEHFTLNEELSAFYQTAGDGIPASDVLERAKAANDLGVVVLTRASGENMDNSSDPGEFRLTEAENRLIQAVTTTFNRTVVILNTPYPIDTSFVARHDVDALVLAGVGGMLAGPAVVHVLDGTVNPSGKLPDTWAKAYDDIPASRNFYDCADGKPRYTADSPVWVDTVYEEGIYVGYRYFSTFGVEPAYPFGFGLSYTQFKVCSEDFRAPEINDGRLGTLSVAATVTNSGDVPGREVVQVYVSKPDGVIEQPALELVDFAKTSVLEPGDSEQLLFKVAPEALTSFDETTAAYVAPAGEYVLRVGTSAAQTREAGRFSLAETIVVRQAKHRMLPVEPVATLSKHDPQGTFPDGKRSGVKAGAAGYAPVRPVRTPAQGDGRPDTPVRRSRAVTFAEVQANPDLAGAFVDGLGVDELARLTVCAQNGWGMEGTGVAGIMARPDGLGLPRFQVADGNSGINVNTPNIGFPTSVVLCSTFDRDLALEVGRILGTEAHRLDVDVLLAPALNLHRHPLNGRHPEYFSEDPVLAGTMAGSYAKGVESTGVGACYKHVAANNAESSRKRNQSIIPERALRELYLKAFEIALRTHPAKTIMTGYNAVNGVHTAADPELIQGVFREEFGFDGAVMTDWNSYDTCDVVDMVAGGNNWLTPGSQDETYTKPIIEAVKNGALPEAKLRESVTHLLRLIATLT